MSESKQFTEWLLVRRRLLHEEREFAKGRQAAARGEAVDLEALSVQESEVRALRALARAMVRRAARTEGPGE